MTRWFLSKRQGRWRLHYKVAGGEAMYLVGGLPHKRKADAIRAAVVLARRLATKANPISLTIRTSDGSFLEERTYPRTRDPKRYKG